VRHNLALRRARSAYFFSLRGVLVLPRLTPWKEAYLALRYFLIYVIASNQRGRDVATLLDLKPMGRNVEIVALLRRTHCVELGSYLLTHAHKGLAVQNENSRISRESAMELSTQP
jgi:hypothetical protein